ncbi:unnamed protein product, partial [Scytosiphon promiscuus]
MVDSTVSQARLSTSPRSGLLNSSGATTSTRTPRIRCLWSTSWTCSATSTARAGCSEETGSHRTKRGYSDRKKHATIVIPAPGREGVIRRAVVKDVLGKKVLFCGSIRSRAG